MEEIEKLVTEILKCINKLNEMDVIVRVDEEGIRYHFRGEKGVKSMTHTVKCYICEKELGESEEETSNVMCLECYYREN